MSGEGEMASPPQKQPLENTDNNATAPSLVRRRKLVECAQDTIEQASELIKRRIPCVGHVLAPKRLWLKRVSTPNCDVVVVFPPNTQDSVLLWLLSRLRQSPGLTVHVRHHASTQSSAFYLTAPIAILLRAAEEYHLPKSLKASKGGGLKEFIAHDVQYFEGSDNEQSFFTSQERQWLVLRLLESIRAKTSDSNALSGLNLPEGQPIVPKCLSAGIISQVFPLHEPSSLDKLQNTWVRDVFAKQPLDEIAEYFGVKIAMYFAWLGHYTTALSIPAVVGFIFWYNNNDITPLIPSSLCCNGKHQTLEDLGYVLFSVFNIVWVTTYLQAFKRYSAELAFRWGTLDQRDDLLAEPRSLFRGPLQESPVTGRLEPWQPAWKRHVYRYCVTVPIIAVCLSAVFVVMIASLHVQDWWDNFVQSRGYPDWLGYLPKIMLAVVITLMDEAYFKIALWLNDKENYRLETKYENHLIGKVALFQFINSFLSLFYIAFYLQDQARLKEQLAALLISRQVIGNLKESAIPYILEHMKLAKISFDLWGALSPTGNRLPPGEGEEGQAKSESEEPKDSPVDKRSMSQAELESSLYKLGRLYDGTFSEHLEMTIQLGYVILFSSAFPPAAICAMFNNMIEIRSDAFKLAYVCQRPFGQRVPNIGTWQHCMEYMSIIAVLVNCALIGLSGQVHRMFPDMTATQTILLIVALEHIMLCIRFIITCAIPDIPGWLATEMAKIEWARREASRLSTATPSPEDVTSKLIGRFSVSPSHSLVTQEPKPKEDKRKEDVNAKKRGSATSISSAPTPTTPTSHVIHKPISITPDSIQAIPPFKPRKSKDWMPLEGESHHLTIGPTGGAEWAKKLKEENDIHRSTDCITPKLSTDASSSDSDLLKSSPVWPPRPRSPSGAASSAPIVIKTKTVTTEASLSDSAKSVSSQETADEAARAAEELAAKKTRVKQSLMKRARSVAIFSLKLKERRAREAAEKANKAPITPTAPPPPPPQCGGGELSCIPIEKLIQLEDLRQNALQRTNQSGSLS
ncbi:PREDICTED: anoctamin-8 isoform X3 [Nicrophorus vespilloides]|uniref:Anoctamin n=1 Tax=Nicrophorus vespilloides TaxID=110193 RepID=A0ABM1MG91_NICVS|nr:PREDICTED: anoctamin-8 isoform X3 [Nicrophorus vespilloides]